VNHDQALGRAGGGHIHRFERDFARTASPFLSKALFGVIDQNAAHHL
jgi:hypothetical protein